MGVRRTGLSIVEVIVILAILAVTAIPFLSSFTNFSRSAHRSARHTAAVYVGQAVIEQLRQRVMIEGELDAAALTEAGGSIVAGGGPEASQYFARFEDLQGSGLHGIREADQPELYAQLSHFTCDVAVVTGAAVGVDADGDGAAEPDLVEVGVTVRWRAPAGGEREATLWTLLTPYEGGRP